MIAFLITWTKTLRNIVSDAMALRAEMNRKHGFISE
jgi:hypothetical protein